MRLTWIASLLVAAPVARPGWALSLLILLVMCLILGASLAMFYVLVSRWTSRRQWVSLADWARQEGFARPRGQLLVPESLKPLGVDASVMRLMYANETTTLLQMELAVLPSTAGEPPEATGAAARRQTNVLIRELATSWRPVGLRPTLTSESLLDRFSLSSFPLLGTQERFVVYATDAAEARAISDSGARTLLPPDVGMLLNGNALLLDFTNRPFDTIELNRMRALAEQLHDHLPASPL